MKHKTKIIFALLIVVVTLCCLLLSGCHQHDYSKTVVKPTCTERGYTQYMCTCGDTYQEDYVDALGHNYKETKVSATCVKKGYTLHECTWCQNRYSDNMTSDYSNHVGVGKCTECRKDFFDLLKNHCINHGSYESGEMYMIVLDPLQYDETTFIPALSYDAELNNITWLLQASLGDSTHTLMITIDEIDGTYSYIIQSKSSFDVTMMGNFNASSLSKLSSLPYTISSTSITSLNASLSKVACSLAQVLVTIADIYYAENGLQITSVNLGFN